MILPREPCRCPPAFHPYGTSRSPLACLWRRYERLLKEGFVVISDALAAIGQIFVDTKFEFGYVTDSKGARKLIYMDEVSPRVVVHLCAFGALGACRWCALCMLGAHRLSR